jgi:hypothetical protein
VAYSNLVAPLINGVKEFFLAWSEDSKQLHAKIDEQQKQIEQMQKVQCRDHAHADFFRLRQTREV